MAFRPWRRVAVHGPAEAIYLDVHDELFAGHGHHDGCDLWKDDAHLTSAGYARYGAFVASAVPDPGDGPVAWVGDSWARRAAPAFEQALAERFNRHVPVVVHARTGRRLVDMLDPLRREALPARPTMCVLEFGANDLTRKRPPDQFAADLRTALAHCHTAGVPVVIPGVPPIASRSAAARHRNELARNLVRGL